MATATATRTRTLDVTCPDCLDPTKDVFLKLGEVPTYVCDCGEEFTPADAAAKFAAMAGHWGKVAAWIDSAPTTD